MRFLSPGFLLCFLILWTGCSTKPAQPPLGKYTESRFLLGAIVKVDVCYDEGSRGRLRDAYEEVWKRIEDIHWRMSVFDEKSDVMRVNNSYPETVEVGKDTYELIKDSFNFFKVTAGVFDITVYPLIKLWKDAEKRESIPSPQEIQTVKGFLGARHVELLPENRVRLLNSHTKIDLNSIAEGYAADEAARILRTRGYHDFLVDAGGDLFASGHNCEGKPWGIGIRNPQDPTQLIAVVNVVDQAVTTSGNYEHYYEIQGQKWSHIMNPITGFPQMEVSSATVIAPITKDSDVLSTALCILNGPRGISLIDSLGRGYASYVLIKDSAGHYKEYMSKNFLQYRSR